MKTINRVLTVLAAAFITTTINSCEWSGVEAEPLSNVNQSSFQGIQFHQQEDNLNVWKFEEGGCFYVVAMTNKGVSIVPACNDAAYTVGASVNIWPLEGVQMHTELDNLRIWRFQDGVCGYMVAVTDNGVDITEVCGGRR